MRTHLNTLFVTLEDAYLRKDGAAVEVRHDGMTKLRIPLHNLDGIVVFGWDSVASASLLAACAEADVSITFLSPHGKFLATSRGYTPGNILLRRDQYRSADQEANCMAIAANMIAAKLANCRHLLLRTARESGERNPDRSSALLTASDAIASRIPNLRRATNLESIRGIEGDAATFYFKAFPQLLVPSKQKDFPMKGRTRRPPLDPVNAVLSFLYVLLMHDCHSALESCGLDPQCGFLHRDRSGRPSLALDLMEEFRPLLADRAALALINRQQISTKDFDKLETGACVLKEDSRKKVLVHWQERKQKEILHPFLEEKVSFGLLPHLQARLLARCLRGDLDAYPAFLIK